MGKPNKLTYMVPGKSIGATVHKGLADTFNWLVNFCNNLKGDDASITIDNELGDWPTIRATSMGVEGAESECDCELTPCLEEGTKIAEWTKNGVTTDIYAPSGSGPSPTPEEATTLKGTTSDSVKIGPGDLNFKSGDYSNVEVKTDGTDITISVYYL